MHVHAACTRHARGAHAACTRCARGGVRCARGVHAARPVPPLQVGRDDGGLTWRLLGLLSQLVDQPFYAELRTKQQLGYIVGSSVTESEGVRGLVFSVQSSVPRPRQNRRA